MLQNGDWKFINDGYLDMKSNLLQTWWLKVTFLGWLSDPFKGLSDLQLGDQKVTLNHLEMMIQKSWVPNPDLSRLPSKTTPGRTPFWEPFF